MENFKLKLLSLFFLIIATAYPQGTFYLTSNKIFSQTEDPTFNIETVNLEGEIQFKAYFIDNPIEFFENQKNINSPEFTSNKKKEYLPLLDNSINYIFRDLRNATRKAINFSTRGNLRDVLDVKKAEEKKKIIPEVEFPSSKYKVIKSWKEGIKKKYDYWNYYTIKFPINQKGVYLIEASYKNQIGYTALIISDYVLITKRINERLLVFALDKRSGQKINGLELSAYNNGEVFEKEKISDGECEFKIPELKKEIDEDPEWADVTRENYTSNKLLIMGYNDNNFIIYDPSSGYYDYSDSDYYDPYNLYPTYFYTDRPIYRPGQEVFYKTIALRKDKNGQLQNANNEWIVLKISDPNNKVIKKDSTKLTDYGTNNGKLILPIDAKLGMYNVEVYVNGKYHSFYFEVQEYKKPEFKVEVAFNEKRYTIGDQIKGKVTAKYFFGSPVRNSKVELYIYRSKYYIPWYADDENSWFYSQEDEDYYSYSEDLIETVKGNLNDQGEYEFSIETALAESEDYRYRVQAHVTDNSKVLITGAKSVICTRGDYYIRSYLDKYVYEISDNVKFNVEIFNFDNEQVRANFELSVYLVKWEKNQSVSQSGYEMVQTEKFIQKLNGTSEKNKISNLPFTPKEAGYYKYVISTSDKRGRNISEESYFYVAQEGSDYYWNTSTTNLKLIPDKKTYSLGEKINLLIISPIENVDVVFTSEADNIYDKKFIHLKNKSELIQLDVKKEYIPNVFLNAVVIKGSEIINGQQTIKVIPTDKFLNVTINFDKKEYRPQEEATITVDVKDMNGNGVKDVELSCGLVDEAIYSIRKDNNQDIKSYFYSSRYNNVNTSYSNYFYFYGYSRAIRYDEYSDLLSPIKKQMLSKNKLERSKVLFAELKGAKVVIENVRRDFRDLAYWNANIYTDNNGRASFKTKLPDNLTSWRATVKAVSEDAAVGNYFSNVICKKNLMATIITPRFFVENDNAEITGQLHNQTEYDKYVNIDIFGSGLEIIDRKHSVLVPKYSTSTIKFKVNTKSSGLSKLGISASDGKDSDAMEINIPIITFGMKRVISDQIILDSKRTNGTKEINLDRNLNFSNAKIKFFVSPSLASLFLTSLPELIGYPYGCVEQTMSKFLPTLIVSNAIDQLDIPFDEKLKSQLPKMLKSGLERITDMKNEEGAWGWWKNEKSDPYMTALVVYGLKIAKQNKLDVPDDMLKSGCNFLNKSVNDYKIKPELRAYCLYSLSTTNYYNTNKQKDFILGVVNRILNLKRDPIVLANLSSALFNFGFNEESKKLAYELDSKSTNIYNYKYWKTTEEFSQFYDEVELAAIAANVFIKNKFAQDKIENIINYLVGSIKGSSWNSTKQTATIIYSLKDYLEKTKELNPNYNLDVYVENKLIKTIKVNKDNLFKSAIEFESNLNNLNNITVKSNLKGSGKAYINYNLEFFEKRNSFLNESKGIAIKRNFFKLEQYIENEEIKYRKVPLGTTIKQGEIILVKLELDLPQNMNYLMIEEPLLAGGVVALNNSDYKIQGEESEMWYVNKEVRDQKIGYFISEAYKGKMTFYYIFRALIPGEYNILPTTAQLMYFPKIQGNSNNEKFNIYN